MGLMAVKYDSASFKPNHNEANCVIVRTEADDFVHVVYWELNIDKKFKSQRIANIEAINLAKRLNTYAISVGGRAMVDQDYDTIEELVG